MKVGAAGRTMEMTIVSRVEIGPPWRTKQELVWVESAPMRMEEKHVWIWMRAVAPFPAKAAATLRIPWLMRLTWLMPAVAPFWERKYE